jgi:DNA repair photolyase
MRDQPTAEESLGGIRGRGAVESPGNRFEKLRVEIDWGAVEEIQANDPDADGAPLRKTVYFRDDSQSIISTNDSPDLGFDASLNPYRGCEHGCAYCYARPYHEYLGFNAGLDFESKIMVKERAAELLERELSAKNWQPKVLACSGVTDCYQPVERELRITRSCLEVLARFRNPVGIITKNALVTRDKDYLSELASDGAAFVHLSITSLDRDLARVLEPRASGPESRLRAIRELTEAGIPVGVSAAPMIPGLNDHEIPAILNAAAEHGAVAAFYTAVRLPYGVADLFSGWLERHFPDRKERVLGRIREMRGGQLNDGRFGERMRGSGPIAEGMRRLFEVSRRRAGLDRPRKPLNTAAFQRPGGIQLEWGF